MKTCYIVGAGDFYGSISPGPEDLVIAADGGYAELMRRSIRPHLLVGDFDSIEAIPSDIETVRFPIKKDETDMHLAYLEGKRRGYSMFKIYGGVGGRTDHTFANYCLLSYIASEGKTAFLYDRGSIAYAIRNNTTRVTGKPGNSISVFAFGGKALGVTIEGLEYELTDGILEPEFPLGVSNSFRESGGTISVKDGTLLIISQI